MRLTGAEVDAILACARRIFGAGCTVRLFGSRADDRKRGGDIDLHIVAALQHLATVENEIRFSVALQDAIGEQRIDVMARPPGFTPQPIDAVVFETGVTLA